MRSEGTSRDAEYHGLTRAHTRMGRIAAVWAPLGVSILFGLAVFRLVMRGLAEVGAGLTAIQWTVLLLTVALFVYGEGFLALQRHWVPRMAERASRLRASRSAIVLILAPLHAMSLLGGSTRELVRGWSMVAAIVAAVIVIEWLPAPWRGIVDLGVACALAWGLLFVAEVTLRAAVAHSSPELLGE